MGPSTRNLAAIPEPDALRRLGQSLAVLDMILCDEAVYRYYTFDAAWGDGEALFAMSNGSGDDFHVVFSRQGVVIKGFGHESGMTPWYPDHENPKIHAGVLDVTPDSLRATIADAALNPEATSFCIWRGADDAGWQIGPIDPDPDFDPDPDGSADLLHILDGSAETYATYARDYFEVEIAASAVQPILDHQPLTEAMVQALDPQRRLADLHEELAQVGYPVAD